MTNRMVVGMAMVAFLGCSDAGGTSSNPSLDERCPFAHVPGVVFALRREDGTDACVYQCRLEDDAGVHPGQLCGTACVAVDTPENCGRCGNRCTARAPYCNSYGSECLTSPPPHTP